MRNKYNYGELVKISGKGKNYGKTKNKLGFIIEKDSFYRDYLVDLIFNNKDWFEEKNIHRIFGTKKNKVEKYQIGLCTTFEGYTMIKENLKQNEPISNNKINKTNLYIEFEKEDKKYIIIGWNSVVWPISNKSIKIIEDTIKNFRGHDIPFQYVVINEECLNDIEIHEYIENDNNVKVFYVERNIKIKNIKEIPLVGWEKG